MASPSGRPPPGLDGEAHRTNWQPADIAIGAATSRPFGFKAPLRRAGLPDIRFHDLRHTFATLQLMAGTNPKIVSEVLGHEEIVITLDRYSHALPTMQTEAMARLDAVLGRSPLDRAETAVPLGFRAGVVVRSGRTGRSRGDVGSG